MEHCQSFQRLTPEQKIDFITALCDLAMTDELQFRKYARDIKYFKEVQARKSAPSFANTIVLEQ